MKLQSITLIFLFIIFALITITSSQGFDPDDCLQYSGGVCIRCGPTTHLYNGLCYNNILGCLNYRQGGICTQCELGDYKLERDTCGLLSDLKLTRKQTLQLLTKYSGGNKKQDPGANYGQAGFLPMTTEEAFAQKTFAVFFLNVTKGQHSSFLRRINPVYSVHYYKKNNTDSYKILYHGSGGGLYLCIGDVTVTEDVKIKYTIELRSLVAISAYTDNCVDYSSKDLKECLRCGEKFHLQNGQCYENSGGCKSYRQNICISCLDNYLLVENRCISDCLSVSDVRSILYYHDNRYTSTLQTFYGVSISQYYTIIIKNTTITLPSTLTTVTTTTTTTTSTNSGLGNNAVPGSSNSGIISSSAGSSQGGSINLRTKENSNSGSALSNLLSGLTNSSTFTSNSTSTSTASSSSSNSNGGGITVIDSPNLTFDSTIDPNCGMFDNNKKCIKCALYFYLDKNMGSCRSVSPFCQTYSQDDGKCQTCFSGFNLQKGDCTIAQ